MAENAPPAPDADPAIQIVVPDALRNPHELVRLTKEYLEIAAASSGSDSSQDDKKRVLNVEVSRQSRSRALRIMDTLIKAWESRGGTVTIGQSWGDATKWCSYFGIGEDRVAVRLVEKQQRVPGPPTRRPWEQEWKCTGQLALSLDHIYDDNLRSTWADGKRQRLENILDSLMRGMLQHVAYKKQERLDNKIHERQRQRATEKREAAKRHEAEEGQRREQLKTAVDHWLYAERIRQYLTAIEAGIADGKLRIRDEQAFAKWFEWAHWYADHVDPLIHAEPLPEKISPPINTPLSEVELTSRLRPIIDGLGIQLAFRRF